MTLQRLGENVGFFLIPFLAVSAVVVFVVLLWTGLDRVEDRQEAEVQERSRAVLEACGEVPGRDYAGCTQRFFTRRAAE